MLVYHEGINRVFSVVHVKREKVERRGGEIRNREKGIENFPSLGVVI